MDGRQHIANVNSRSRSLKTKPKPTLIFKNCSRVCISLCTTVVHNTAQKSSDNFPSYPPDNHHISDDVYWKGRAFIFQVSLNPASPQLSLSTYSNVCILWDSGDAKDFHSVFNTILLASCHRYFLYNTIYVRYDSCSNQRHLYIPHLCIKHFTYTQLFYSHHTGQPALAGIPVKNWKIMLEQSCTAHMPLLMANSAFRLGIRH